MKVLIDEIARKILRVEPDSIPETGICYVIKGTQDNPISIILKIISRVVDSDIATIADIGKILNEDDTITEPQTTTNPYGIPDSVYNSIKDDSVDEVKQEVTANGTNTETA